MYDHALHRGRKHLCRYCLQAFSEKKKCYVCKDSFEINGKQITEMPRNGEHV